MNVIRRNRAYRSPDCESLPLPQRVPWDSVKVAKVLSFNEIQPGALELIEQFNDVAMAYICLLGVHKAAPPVIGAKGFWQAVWPYLHATISDHQHLQGMVAETLQDRSQIFRDSSRQCMKTSTPTRSFFSGGFRFQGVLARVRMSALRAA